jgi:hypothetical protein
MSIMIPHDPAIVPDLEGLSSFDRATSSTTELNLGYNLLRIIMNKLKLSDRHDYYLYRVRLG